MQRIFLAVIVTAVIIYTAFYQFTYHRENWKRMGQYVIYIAGGSLTEVDVFDFCPFEAPDPWHESVLKFVDVKYGFDTCRSKILYEPVTILENKRVFPKESGYDCEGRCLFYVDDSEYNAAAWAPTHNTTFHCDFVETSCKKGDDTRQFVHIQLEEKASHLNTSQVSREANPDVHLFILDSVASTQLIRALPRTVNFLLHALSAVEFRKFNKVGDNSRPNSFAALLGKTTEEVERKVMNLDTIPADLSYADFCYKYLDNETYIPHEYHNAGYRTCDAEDSGNSALRYPNCKGMSKDIMDHYYRPFHQRLHKDTNISKILYEGQCRSSIDYMLDYLTLFLNAYQDTPKFSLIWNAELAHDDSQVLYKADLAIYNFLVKNKNSLSNSFIFFFGDHGPRYGKEASTWLGAKERNNPFLYITVPYSVRKTALYQQLRRNSEELVTHHDLYATLLDILRFQPASNFTDANFKRFDAPARGSSLLRAFETGKPRNCKTLPIPFQYCICQFVKKDVTDNSTLFMLGEFASTQLQLHLDSHNVTTKCERIKLLKTEAKQYVTVLPNVTHVSISPAIVYDVTFEVSPPAKGKFLIPVRKEGEHLQLAGEVFSRLDRYGKRGDCMKKDVLKAFCTCK